MLFASKIHVISVITLNKKGLVIWMKKILFVFLITLVMFLINTAHAQKSTFEKILLFGSGYLTGHLAHEAGHQITAWSLDVPLYWQINNKFEYLFWDVREEFGYNREWYWYAWNKKTYSLKQNSDFRKIGIVATGGFGAEIVSSEIILATSSLKTTKGEINYFLLGWLTQTIANPILYVAVDNLSANSYGDLQTIEKYGGNHHKKNIVKTTIVIHAISVLLRTILKTADFNGAKISATRNTLLVSINMK